LSGLASPPECIDAGASLADAALYMGRRHIGSLVVVEHGAPVGLVTDRDVALAGCLRAPHAPPPPVGAVASRPLVTLPESATLEDLTALFASRCIRRVGLVDGRGALVGIVSSDSVVQFLGRHLGELARTFEREFEVEREQRDFQPSTFGTE
jgi:CBS domain-containing protein